MTTYFKALDLFALFVEHTFGSIFLAGIGIAVILLVIGIISRMSEVSIYFIVGTFILVFAVGYVGALAAVPVFILAVTYFVSALLAYFSSLRT